MDIIKYDFYSGPNIGIYSKVNDEFVFLPSGFVDTKSEKLSESTIKLMGNGSRSQWVFLVFLITIFKSSRVIVSNRDNKLADLVVGGL